MSERVRRVLFRRRVAGLLACVAAAGGLATAAMAGRVTRIALPGTIPSYAGRAVDLGRAAPTAPARALISLQHRRQAGLLRFIAQVSAPTSPLYAHYLTPAQFVARYAPSRATVSSVEAFARHNGLRVVSVPRNRAYLYVTGPVSAMDRAFGTRIERFSLHGYPIQAPTRALSVPSRFAGRITGVTGLDTGAIVRPMIGQTPPVAAYVNAQPESAFWAQKPAAQAPGAYGQRVLPDITRGYTPRQLEGAYGLAGLIRHGIDGRGQTVATIDAYSSPTMVQDADRWSQLHGLPKPKLTIVDNALERDQPEAPAPVTSLGFQDPQNWFGEETLDVEAIHAMAPGARIVVQSARSNLNMDLEMAQNNVVSGKLAQIVSNSYGGSSDTTNTTSDGYWQQAAAQGMGVYFSSGDDGDQTSGGTSPSSRSVDSGANSPYVTAVGGTTLAVGRGNSYDFETYWGTDTATLTSGKWGQSTWDYGGGGGTSEVYPEPAWQEKVVPGRFADFWKGNPNAASGADVPGRVVPDVAIDGDPNSGLLIGMTEDFSAYANPDGYDLPTDSSHYGEYRLGGTSLASPLFAGVMALADQAAGRPHGFADPALYRLYGSRAYHDVTTPGSKVAVVRTNYTNSTNAAGGTQVFLRLAGVLGTLSSVHGYDDSTGLGTPNGLAFVSGLAPGSRLLKVARR